MSIITGIDIGTYTVRVVIAEHTPGAGLPRIIGKGFSESHGLRHGYIINIQDATRSIRAALDQAEREANVHVREAFISVGGVGLEGTNASGSAIISRADSEITENDVDRALRLAENAVPQSANKKVLLTIPIEYRIDGKKIYGRPTGMKGLKLECSALIVTSLEQHLHDLIRAVEEADIEVIDVMATPIVASFVALNKAQKMAGCVLVNIGAETISVVVFEEGTPISLEVFPVGSTDITNDIALGLTIPLEEAELIKLGRPHQYARRRLSEIVETRMKDMFNLVNAHLKKLGKNELLPAGIILTGGGSGIETIEDFARAAMKLPSKVATMPIDVASGITATPDQEGRKDTSWFVAYGLCIWGVGNDRQGRNTDSGAFARIKKFGKELMKQLIP